jgi:hypothetical protein
MVFELRWKQEPRIIYVPSAFKHGVSGENIHRALAFPEYEGPLEDDGDRRIVPGFDYNGNLLEIFYYSLMDEPQRYAMKRQRTGTQENIANHIICLFSLPPTFSS